MSNNSGLWHVIAVLLSVLLIPVVPAILIYKVLPDEKRVSVRGPFEGMQVNATGSFAAYFVLVLVSLVVTKGLSNEMDTDALPFDVWLISGNVRLDNSSDSLTSATITLFPPVQTILRTGHASATFETLAAVHRADLRAGAQIQISDPPYTPASIPLRFGDVADPITKESFRVRTDLRTHTILIEDTLVLHKLPTPYQPQVAITPDIDH